MEKAADGQEGVPLATAPPEARLRVMDGTGWKSASDLTYNMQGGDLVADHRRGCPAYQPAGAWYSGMGACQQNPVQVFC